MVKDFTVVCFKPSSQTLVDVEVKDVVELKKFIADKLGIDQAIIKLSYQGSVLDDGRVFGAEEIPAGQKVYLLLLSQPQTKTPEPASATQEPIQPTGTSTTPPTNGAATDNPIPNLGGFDFSSAAMNGQIPPHLQQMMAGIDNEQYMQAIDRLRRNPQVLTEYLNRIQSDPQIRQMAAEMGVTDFTGIERALGALGSSDGAGAFDQPAEAPNPVNMDPSQYTEQLKSMADMGFTDQAECLRVLYVCNGNVEQAINLLLADE